MSNSNANGTDVGESKRLQSERLDKVVLFLLPGIAVVVSLALQHRSVSFWFWLWVVLSALAGAVSFYFGGLALSRLRRGIQSRISLFNLQAVFVIISAAALVLSYISLGEPKSSSADRRMDSLQQSVGALKEAAGQNSKALERIEAQVHDLEKQLAEGDAAGPSASDP